MREYDLYEHMADGSLYWRGFARGIQKAHRRLFRLTAETGHACYGINLVSKHVIEENPPGTKR